MADEVIGSRRTSRDRSIKCKPARRRCFAAMVRYLLLLRLIAARRAQAMSGWRRRREQNAIDFAGVFWLVPCKPTFWPLPLLPASRGI